MAKKDQVTKQCAFIFSNIGVDLDSLSSIFVVSYRFNSYVVVYMRMFPRGSC